MATTKPFKIPADLGAAGDLYYTTRERRLALQKDVEALEKEESQLKEHLINNLKKSTTGVAGKVCRVQRVDKTRNEVQDWDSVYDYIKKNAAKGAFALVQRRLSDAAVNEIFASGKTVPGVVQVNYAALSVNKLG